MKICHENPSPEIDWQVQAILYLETPQGQTVRIVNWSLSGLQWPPDAPPCPATGTLTVPFQGVDVRFPVRLSAPDSTNKVHLQGLSGRQRETLSLFYRSLLCGRMASSGEVITSLDTPLDLVPMGETEEELASGKAKAPPRLLRSVISVLTYLLIAAAVVGIVGKNIFSNLDRIDIQHGRVVAAVVPLQSVIGGTVEQVLVAPGDVVAEGAALMRIRNPEVQAELSRTQAELHLATAALQRIEVAMTELDDLRDSQDHSLRMAVSSRLYDRFVGQGGFDDIRRQWITLRDQEKGVAKVYDPLEIIFGLLQAQAERAAADVVALTAIRDGQREAVQAANLVAPTNGVVGLVQVHPGQYLHPDTPALEFETAEPRTTAGWISERFAETIYIGMPARIGWNEDGTRSRITGTVTNVQAGDHPERPGEFGIIVTVAADGLDAAQTRARLRVGAPVNLEANRQLPERLRNWVRDLVGGGG